MILKILVLLALVAILVSLGRALYFLVKDTSGTNRVVKALTWRIALSIILFLFVILSLQMGWVHH